MEEGGKKVIKEASLQEINKDVKNKGRVSEGAVM